MQARNHSLISNSLMQRNKQVFSSHEVTHTALRMCLNSFQRTSQMTIATLLHIAEKNSKYTEIQKLILGITYEVGSNLFRTIHKIV